MESDPLAPLRTPAGEAALATAERVADGRDPLAAASALRAAGVDAALAALALTQVDLRRRAVAKFGAEADGMLLTRVGLEQATRAPVAARRAERLARAGVRRVADLGCGLGSDTIAFARAGLEVLAVEADPATAACAVANAAAAGVADRVNVHCGDATDADLSTVDAAFCDPARRDGRTGRRVFDPAAYSPSWSFLTELRARIPHTVLKLAPGLDHALLPAGAEAEWVSVDGDVVELALWPAALATVPRRATLLRGGRVDSLTGTGQRAAPAGPVGAHIYDLDGAVVRAHLVAEAADEIAGRLADPRIAYVFTDDGRPTRYGRRLAVVEELPIAAKRLRAALRARDIGVLEILCRGVPVDPAQLRRDLRLAGARTATLVLTRVADRPTALLCHPS
jgi:SAM-dependent methyltransferase